MITTKSFQRLQSNIVECISQIELVDQALKAELQKNAKVSSRFRSAMIRNARLGPQYGYVYITGYLRDILSDMYLKKPIAIIGKHNGSFRFHEIVEFGTYEAIVDHMLNQIFRSLESTKSTLGLLEKILDHTKVVIPDENKLGVEKWMEIRHLIVHNNSVVDKKFAAKYGDGKMVKEGSTLNIQIGDAKKCLKEICEICRIIDAQLIGNEFA